VTRAQIAMRRQIYETGNLELPRVRPAHHPHPIVATHRGRTTSTQIADSPTRRRPLTLGSSYVRFVWLWIGGTDHGFGHACWAVPRPPEKPRADRTGPRVSEDAPEASSGGREMSAEPDGEAHR